MAGFDAFRAKYPGYSDDEILGALQATKYPEYSVEEIGKAVGYNPSDLGRGFKESFQQLPQLGYGVIAGVGAAGEAALGEGGIMSGIKRAGVAGYNRWGDKIEAGARESDSFSASYDQAKEGNFGALVDWLQHGIGYTAGQGLQALASAGIGAVGGKFVLGVAAKELAKGMVMKEAAAIGATAEGKALAQDVLIAQATKNVAGKIGQTVGVGAMAFGQEGGEIFGDLTAQAEKEGRQLNGAELAKAFGATLAAGSLEFVGDKLGLDIVMGKSSLLKPAGAMTGFGGRAARGGIAAAAAAPIEAGTEYFQTGLEEFGKGKENNILPFNQSPAAQVGAFDAAALGGLGGASVGLGGGLMSKARAADAERRLATAPDVGSMVQAATDLAMTPLATTPLTPPVRPREAGADTMAEIRQLDPADQQEAIGLLDAANNRNAPGNVRRYAQNRLDELLMPVRQPPVTRVQVDDVLDEAGNVIGPATSGLRLGYTPPGADPLALPAPDGPPVYMADAQGNVSQQPAVARSEALNRDFEARRADETAAEFIRRRKLEMGKQTPRGDEPIEKMPVGEVSRVDLIPTGEATDWEYVPTGQATEIDPEVVQADDFLTGDGQPYGTQSGAAVRARREGLTPAEVVNVAGGWVVRPQPTALGTAVDGRPNNTRSTTAADVLRSNREPVTDLAGTPGRLARPADGVGGMVQDTPAPTAGRPADAALENGAGEPSPALTTGSRVNYDGKTWTVIDASPRMIRLDDGQGMSRAISQNSEKWKQVTPVEQGTADAKPAASTTRGEAPAPATAAPTDPAAAGTGQAAAVEADGVKPPESALHQALRSVGIDPDAPRDKAKDKATAIRKQADTLMTEARKMLEGIPPGQPVRSTRDANLRERAREKTRKAGELQREADALEAPSNVAAPVQAGSGGAAPAPVAAATVDSSLKDRVEAKRKPADAPTADPAAAAPPAEASPTVKESLSVAEPKTKRPPKSFRKKHTVTTSVFVEESGKFEQREIDADTALKALDDDIAEMTAFRRCITGG